MKIRMRVEGLKECRDAMASLSTATQRNIMRRILVERGKPIQDMAKRLAPVDTGFLAWSVRTQSRTAGGAGRAAFAAVMAGGGDKKAAGSAARAANRAAKMAVEIYIGPNAGPREIIAEYGSSKSTPQPFMRPAWDANKNSLLNNIASDMMDEIRKAIRRKEKKAAKIAAAAGVES